MKRTALFFDNGQPTEPLLHLLDLFQVRHQRTLKSIRDVTQHAWYQQGKLRAEIVDRAECEWLRTEAMRIFEQLGMVKEVSTKTNMHYKRCLLLGATVVAVRKRLAFLKDTWNAYGARFGELILLGSERDLLPEKEVDSILFNHQNEEFPFPQYHTNTALPPPRNEIEMMQMVYNQSEEQLPWKGRIGIKTVSAPGRANTLDTVREMLKGGSWDTQENFLAVSSQPFVSYQQLTIAKEMALHHPKFYVDTIGYAASSALPITTYLDNVAKVIYELEDDATF